MSVFFFLLALGVVVFLGVFATWWEEDELNPKNKEERTLK